MRDLTKLVFPFPQKVIHTNPSGGGSYVAHPVVEQRILDVLGPVGTSVMDVIRGYVPGISPDPQGKSARARNGAPALEHAVVGVLLTMDATIDGEQVSVTEVGDCESPHNWPHDGARLKDAMSDAYKRCAMRLGVGLHLWAQDDFYLFDKFRKQDEEAEAEPKQTWPMDRTDAMERLTAMFTKAGASAPSSEAEDLLRAMGSTGPLTAREWAAIANAADDIIKAAA